MMDFAVENLKINKFTAKIGDSNHGSLTLFRKLVDSVSLLCKLNSLMSTKLYGTAVGFRGGFSQ